MAPWDLFVTHFHLQVVWDHPRDSFVHLFFLLSFFLGKIFDVISYSILIARLVRGGWLVENWRGLCVWRVAGCPAGGHPLKSSLRDQNWKQYCAILLSVAKTMGSSALWTSCWMMPTPGGPGAREHHVQESLRDQGLFLGKMLEIWLYRACIAWCDRHCLKEKLDQRPPEIPSDGDDLRLCE